jgi:hypothetical protein
MALKLELPYIIKVYVPDEEGITSTTDDMMNHVEVMAQKIVDIRDDVDPVSLEILGATLQLATNSLHTGLLQTFIEIVMDNPTNLTIDIDGIRLSKILDDCDSVAALAMLIKQRIQMSIKED